MFLEGSELPSKELFIRWTELSAYLPAMQFSFVPWQYDDETVEIAREMVRVHEEVVYPILLEAGEEMLRTGKAMKGCLFARAGRYIKFCFEKETWSVPYVGTFNMSMFLYNYSKGLWLNKCM